MNRSIIFLVAILFYYGPAFGQSLEIKGIKPGMTLDALQEIYEDLACPDETKSEEPPTCTYHGKYSTPQIPELDSIAKQDVKIWTFEFTPDDILYSADALLRSTSYAEVKGALITKFGKPTEVYVKQYQNGFGAKIQGEESRWKKSGIELYIRELADRETMFLSINKPALKASINTLKNERFKKAAKDL